MSSDGVVTAPQPAEVARRPRQEETFRRLVGAALETLRESSYADLTVRVYADSYHGFDGTAPVRLRRDVPNGVSPDGVHSGGNAAARAQALDELARFLERRFN